MELKRTDVQKIERFLERIKNETYPEPPSALHTHITQKMIGEFLQNHPLPRGASVLDIGCGQGVALELFQQRGFRTVGITLNVEDAAICRQKGYEVHEMDQSFLDFPDDAFDFIWCRHCLEHSIFPYYTLSEMHRVLRPQGYLYVEVPAPDTSCQHQSNKNHYSVLGKSMWEDLIRRTGFELENSVDITFASDAGPDTYWAFVQKKVTGPRPAMT